MSKQPQHPIAPNTEPQLRGQEALTVWLKERQKEREKPPMNILNKNTLAYSCAIMSLGIIVFWASGEFDTLRTMISIPLIWFIFAIYAVVNREED